MKIQDIYTEKVVEALPVDTRFCPVCNSKDLTPLKCVPDTSCWLSTFECNSCKAEMLFYEGDKMGGQFDVVFRKPKPKLVLDKERVETMKRILNYGKA